MSSSRPSGFAGYGSASGARIPREGEGPPATILREGDGSHAARRLDVIFGAEELDRALIRARECESRTPIAA